jgi:hypothetical protein
MMHVVLARQDPRWNDSSLPRAWQLAREGEEAQAPAFDSVTGRDRWCPLDSPGRQSGVYQRVPLAPVPFGRGYRLALRSAASRDWSAGHGKAEQDEPCGAGFLSRIADRVTSSFFCVVTFTRPEGGETGPGAREAPMRWRAPIRLLAPAAVFTLATVAPSTAGPFARSPLKVVSVSSPFAGCDISGSPG